MILPCFPDEESDIFITERIAGEKGNGPETEFSGRVSPNAK